MGMFDYLKCEYPLDAPSTVEEWQTKDTPGQFLGTYTITKDGLLLEDGEPISFRGEIVFYGNETIDGKDDYTKWWEYSALFDDGKLINMKPMAQGTSRRMHQLPTE